MKSILITGATGFVGRNLIPLLLQQNYSIKIAVRSTVNPAFATQLTVVQVGDINGDTEWQFALQDIDVVIHLAARAHILKDKSPNPEAEFLRVNTAGTANLAQQAMQAGVKHFIFISSIGAVTRLSNHLVTEKSPCQPTSPYGLSKLQAEQALIEIAQPRSMAWTILRPTLVYGKGNPGNMERLVKLIKTSLPLPFGNINNRRSFVYVRNLVDAIATCIDCTNAKNQTFIVSDGEDLSTPELIRRISKAMGKSPLLLPFPPSLLSLGTKIIGKADVSDRLLGSLQVDSSKIRQMLNWKPPYTVDEGMQATVDWLKQQ